MGGLTPPNLPFVGETTEEEIASEWKDPATTTSQGEEPATELPSGEPTTHDESQQQKEPYAGAWWAPGNDEQQATGSNTQADTNVQGSQMAVSTDLLLAGAVALALVVAVSRWS